MSRYHREHPETPHPFAREVEYVSDDWREQQDEISAEFCECDLELTINELDSGRCACCGKAIV